MSLDNTIGGFGKDNSRKRYLHLLIDNFIRYTYSLTSKTQQAKNFIKLLYKVLTKGNQIGTLLTDQYSGINTNDIKKYLKQNNVKLIFTVVDCAFSNGLNERLNQTLVNQIRCKINANRENKKRPWSMTADKCVDEYNNTVHTSTKFSPKYLMNNKDIEILPNYFCIKRNLEND